MKASIGIIRSGLFALGLFALGGPVAALEIGLPSNARLTVERDSALDRYLAPLGAYQTESGVPSVAVEGEVRRAAWRISSPGLTTLQVMIPLRSQLLAAGFEIVLDCDQSTCGGFDFRFETEVMPAPNMRVNMRDFRFLTATSGARDAPSSVVTLMISTTATAAYAQIIQAGEIAQNGANISTAGTVPQALTQPIPQANGRFDEQLLAQGHIVLNGLDFKTGVSDLTEGPFETLAQLGAFLKAYPKIRIALVGHTDSVGNLDGNIALSKRRAGAVRQRLIDSFEIAGSRIEAEGMGYLSPVASNLSPEGREANRRVEAVLLSNE